MAGCNTGRNIQKYKGSGASTLQDALENGNTASLNINLSSPAIFIGDGGGLSNINASATTGNLQAVTDNGATTTNKIVLTNSATSLETSGNIVVSTNVYATEFYGDGGTLSNISANKNFQEVTDIGASTSNKITLTNSVTSLETSGNVLVTGNVTASKFYGDGTTLDGVALSTDLASNSTRIGTVSTDLADNSTRISTVSTDLADNSTRISTVSTDLASNSTRISTVSTDLASNSTRIGTVSTDLADNSTRISTVSTDLVDNSTRISTVSTDLASNSTRIETVSTDLASNSSRIGTVSTDLASNVVRIGVLESEVQPVNRGGTNITSYGVGDMLYASAPSTLSKLTPSTAGYFLRTNGTSNAPTWESVADIGSATPANLYTDDYITGGPWSGISDANIRVLGNVSNLSNQLVARDDKGDIFVSNVNAIRIYGDGTLLTGVALSTDLVSNSTRIGTVSTDLASNSTRIGTVSTDLADNSTRISTVSTDLADNSTRISTVSTDLASNSTRISTVSTDLASNSTRIGTVSTDLASNSSRIGTISTDLADNSTRISTVSTDLASNSTRITNLQNSTIISNSSGITNAFETGDLIYASSQNTLSNLSIGSLNQVLTVSGGIPTWVAPSSGGGGYWTQSGSNIYYSSGNVGISNTAPVHTLDIGSNVAVIDDGVDKLYIRGNVYSTHDIISLGTVHCKEIVAVNSRIKNSTVVTEAPTRQIRSI